MEEIQSQIKQLIEFPIDFEGQKKVDQLIQLCLAASIPASVLAGALTKSIVNLLIAFAICIILTLVVVLPPWPQYKKNPVSWLEVKYDF